MAADLSLHSLNLSTAADRDGDQEKKLSGQRVQVCCSDVLNGNQDGDVETLMPATEDTVTAVDSLVLVESDPVGSYLNDELDEKNGEYMEQNSDDDEKEDEKEDPTSLSESKDPADLRSGLIAQMKVLDAMLQQLETEEQQRAMLESTLMNASANNVSSSHLNMGDGGTFKRQRRPNPKYFDTEIEADFLAPGGSPSMAFRSYGEELPENLVFSDSQPLQSIRTAVGYPIAPSLSHVTFSSFFDRCHVRSAGTHRARTALAQKPRIFSISESQIQGTGAKSDSYLDDLSIRDLHEAYRSTFGKDTSVKDKHWLKRQIFMGSGKQNGTNGSKENSRGKPPLPETSVTARLEKLSSAEAPLSTCGTVGVSRGIIGRTGLPCSSLSCRSSYETKRSHHKTISLGVLIPSGSTNLSTNGEYQENVGGTSNSANPIEAQNTENLVGGKRLRKPNRRYIEDEGDGNLGVHGNRSRSILSSYLSVGNGLRHSASRLSWQSDAEVVGNAYMNGALRSTGIQASRSNSCHGRRSKHGSNGMKRKNEGRAAKLVKMAHSTRAARHDTDGTVRKVKFRLPAAPGQDKGELLNGEDGEQVACLLPILRDGSSEDYQILSSHYLDRLEESNEQTVVTVPTANGGTRRKHHRPWTLREVVTLVEGVSRCGGGKWADIKKLAFSTVGYRTAVDLKDKWRNLLRASRAQLHPPKQGEARKKQFSASIPGHILARVRELAALNNQIVPSANPASNTSRSGRSVHRR